MGDLRFCVTGRFIRMQIHVLVFHRAPEALNKDIVPLGPLAIHADLNTVVGQIPGKGQAGDSVNYVAHIFLKGWSRSV